MERLVLAFGGGVGFRLVVFASQELQTRGIVGREFGGFGKFFDGSWRRHLGEELDTAVVLQAGARGNETAHDDVFLEAAEVVHLPGHGSFGKHASGFLEAGRRYKGVGRERRFGDTEEEWTPGSGTAAFGDDAVVLFAEAELVDLLLEKEGGVANVLDLDPAHHLARDSLNVLVVDVDALQAIDLLNGVDEVGLGVLLAQNREQVVKVERPVDEGLTSTDV